MVVNTLVAAYEGFSFQLLSQLVKQDAEIDIFASPISVAISLAMIYNGARRSTELEIAKILGLEKLNLQEVNAANQFLLMGNSLKPQNELEFANSLWVKQEISLNDDFAQRLRVAYGSEVANLDFESSKASTIINHWVSGNTHQKIKELVRPSQIKGAILVLINAIYFKGIWTQKFDKERTKEGNFTLADGTVKPHLMMSQSGRYRYYEREEFQAVSLPYGDERVSMYIFLPKQSSSLKEFQKVLTIKNWRSWMPLFHRREGDIVLPRFKVEYSKSLNGTLIDLGMGEAFSSNANFEDMGAGALMISQVIHKAVIEINEEGAEAAAATVAILLTGPRRVEFSRFRMIVERPFFYAIRDNQTGVLLFMGFVLNPVLN